jgi:hypothetical protein
MLTNRQICAETDGVIPIHIRKRLVPAAAAQIQVQ